MDITNTAYWVVEFLKVMAGYLLLEFIWPRLVFARHLNGKSMIYQFGFCVTVQTVLLNTLVLGLGLFHILNSWTVRVILYGAPVVSLYLQLGMTEEKTDQFLREALVARTKLTVKKVFRSGANYVKQKLREMRPRALEYLLLAGILVYALIYFSWGAFQVHSYGFGDQYVHHSWIYALKQGQIFYDGVYPEAMHCVIYSIHTLFGIRLYSLMLFLGSIQGVVFLVAIYCLGREVFGWRYTPILVLALYILFVADSGHGSRGMARLQWTLPLEFGLTPAFLCAAYLIRYLRENRSPHGKGRLAKYILGPDLFLFAAALAAMIASHFYPVIIAFFMCLGVAVLYLRRVFSKERFVPLVGAVACAVLISVAPMAGALASGIPFQGSMDWAVSVIEGTDTEARGEDWELQQLRERLQEEELSTLERGRLTARTIYAIINRGLRETSSEKLEKPLRLMLPAILVVCLPAKWLLRRRGISVAEWSKKRGAAPHWLSGYCLLVLIALFLMALYTAPYFGLPELISGVRAVSSIRAVLFGVLLVPLDFGLVLAAGWLKGVGIQGVSLACFAVVCAWSSLPENYHGYLFYELTRYPSEVAVMNQIIDRYPRDSYTAVSPTDGLYHVIEYGRHEELLDFVNEVTEDRYFLPTEHVFLFVEKHPIQYAQRYYFNGPTWLAMEKVFEFDEKEESLAPEILASEISPEAAEQEIPEQDREFLSYKELESRTVVESKAYYWYRQFTELYPRETSVYYEDDDFVCYHIQQEADAPYDLTIAYEE